MIPPSPSPSGPWAGFESLEAAIAGLRRARFRVDATFELASRGLVIEGEILEGDVHAGMVLLATLSTYENVYVSLPISAVEAVDHPGGNARSGLVIGARDAMAGKHKPSLASGRVLDVLERDPTA